MVANAARGGPRTLANVTGQVRDRQVVLDAAVSPLTDDRGVVVVVLVTALDRSQTEKPSEELRAKAVALDTANTELHALNEELRAANERAEEQIRRLEDAEEADSRKDQFLAMLAPRRSTSGTASRP